MSEANWLPAEYTGPRSYEEARSDLACIAMARDPLNQAHVRFLDEGDRWLTGVLSAELLKDSMEVRLDGEPVFSLSNEGFSGATLETRDGATYYALRLQLNRGTVQIEDAYNGV